MPETPINSDNPSNPNYIENPNITETPLDRLRGQVRFTQPIPQMPIVREIPATPTKSVVAKPIQYKVGNNITLSVKIGAPKENILYDCLDIHGNKWIIKLIRSDTMCIQSHTTEYMRNIKIKDDENFIIRKNNNTYERLIDLQSFGRYQ